MNSTDPWQPAARHGRDLIILDNLLGRSKRFRFIIAKTDDQAYRDHLIAHLSERYQGVTVRVPADENAETFDFESPLADAAKGHRVVHWLGLENWLIQSPDTILRRINHGRERLAVTLPVAWVIWLPQAYIAALARGAPDLWAWRDEVLDFTAEPKPLEPVHEHGSIAATRGVEAKEKRARLNEIEAYIRRCDRLSCPDAELMLEAAQIQELLGDFSAALRSSQSAEVAFENLDDPLGVAQAKGQIADILQARGDLDEALRIRNEEQLPVYEKLGDKRALLVGRANMALALLQRGARGDRKAADDALRLALQAAQEMQLPEAQQILGIIRHYDLA